MNKPQPVQAVPSGWEIDRLSGGSISVVPPKPGMDGRVVDPDSKTEGDRLLYSLANTLLCNATPATPPATEQAKTEPVGMTKEQFGYAIYCARKVDAATADIARLRAENAELQERLDATEQADTERLDALANPGWELSKNDDPECRPDELWQVHRVSGGRNDRVWTLIGEGADQRAAIDAAIAARAQKGGK